MFKNIEAVIFDLDGTLIDSMGVWREIDIEFLGDRGIALPQNLQKEIEGLSFDETARYFKSHFLLEESTEEMKKIWLSMAFEKYSKQIALKEGVKDFLKRLKEEKIPMAIASSNHYDLIEAVLKKHEIFSFFDAIHTCDEVKRGKPAPDIYEFVAEKLQVKEKKCLVFEDIVPGILAGKSAGMKTCAVWDAYSTYQDDEKKSLADYYIENYRQIVPLLAEK
ncbi:MAG TPA: HAD family phosphatase [Lachnospiraceae bacterium]